MAFDDLPLDRTTSEVRVGEPPPPSRWRWAAVVLAGLAAGGVLTFWWMGRAQPEPAAPAPTTATDVAVGSNRPKREMVDLPPLDQSDSWLAGLVSTLSKHPTLARFVATPGLVRTSTLAVVQVGQGRTPAEPLKVLRPASRLQIQGSVSGRADPKSYARWDQAVAALTSVSPSDAAQLYVNVKPLFDQAYIELGHPGGNFDSEIVKAIGMLDDTPSQTNGPLLLRRSSHFEYDDAALRALPPVQKQFLLLGPENQQKLLAWLRQFASSLELKTD